MIECRCVRRFLPTVVLLCGLLAAQGLAQDPSSWRARIQAGEAAKVLEEIEALVSQRKDSVEIAIVGAEAALQVGDWKKAGSLADRGKALAPDDPRPYELDGHAEFLRARAEAASGGTAFTGQNFRQAAYFYAKAREKGGDVWRASWFEAEAYAGAGDWLAALDAIRIAGRARAEDAGTAEFEARIHLALAEGGDAEAWKRAAASADRALELAPTLLAAALTRLDTALGRGDRAEVRKVFLELLKAFPRAEGLYEALYQRYREDRPPTFLREVLQAAHEQLPETDRALCEWYLGVHAEITQLWSEAELRFRAYLELVPRAPRAWFKIAWQLSRQQRFTEARDAFAEARALGGIGDDELAFALRIVVAGFAGEKRFAEAASLQGEVTALTGTASDRLDLAILQFNAGRRDEGIASYRALVAEPDLDPDLAARAWNNLGLALQGTGKPKEAESAFQKAIEQTDPASLDALENLGVLLVEQGRPKEAERWLREATKRDPLRHRSRYWLLRALDPVGLGS